MAGYFLLFGIYPALVEYSSIEITKSCPIKPVIISLINRLSPYCSLNNNKEKEDVESPKFAG
jgi:hypothetical protein